MPTFLTVKEAAHLTGKSASSIRRILYKVLEIENHPDRGRVEPNPEAVAALRMKGENFAWKIAEDYLRQEVPEGKANAESKSPPQGGTEQLVAIVVILRKQLDIKDQQIGAQNDVIKGLSERVREGNILMGSLQQQLSLSDGSNRTKSGVVEADPSSRKTQQGTDPSSEASPKKPWLFRKLF